ncbi:TPR-like protein [Amniculicola lignicola CBS 123094]|uniref:TPR-like protein n=1 Tax=Amniculicola lignicola CBS 123094 TaxID=1392246 RepID=A0A6A5WPW3_9PLEO|nr:TPR-like protein [Amniculicola lignicola CBS 123094]
MDSRRGIYGHEGAQRYRIQRLPDGSYVPVPVEPPTNLNAFVPPYTAPGPVRQPPSVSQPIPYSGAPFVSPFQVHQPPPPDPGASYHGPQAPFSTSNYLQSQLHEIQALRQPIVHEGFIPAPGNEDDFGDELDFHRPWYNDDSDDDSETERRLLAEEERIMFEVEARNNNSEEDSDYSLANEDLEELEKDPDEMILDGDIDEDEEEEDTARKPRKGAKGRGVPQVVPQVRTRGRPRKQKSDKVDIRPKTGKQGRPPGKMGPRATADPGPRFKELQRLSNEAYFRGDWQTGIEYCDQAIQMNPEIFATYNILSEIYIKLDDEEKSIGALLAGGPTKRDPNLFIHIIDRIEKVNPKKYPFFTPEAKTHMTLKCLSSMIELNAKDYEARKQKFEIEMKLGRYSNCVNQCRQMLLLRPGDDRTLIQMARLGTSNPRLTKKHITKVLASFETSLDYFLAKDKPKTSRLDWNLLNVYLDILDSAGDYAKALFRLKSLARWIQGREEEKYWDNYTQDDREFDEEDEPRRAEVSEFSRASPSTNYGNDIPIEMRVKMGLFRLRLQPPDIEEALYHLNMLDPEDRSDNAIVFDYPDLFSEIANSLHVAGFDREALLFYEALQSRQKRHDMTLKTYVGFYTSYRNLERTGEARNLVPVFETWQTKSLEEVAVLARLFEESHMEEQAEERAELVYRNGGVRFLNKVGYQGLEELQEKYLRSNRPGRGNHRAKKVRARKHAKKVRNVTRPEEDSDHEGNTRSLGPLLHRPSAGLFRSKKVVTGEKPKAFLPVEVRTLKGTLVPYTAIDERRFRIDLEFLAKNYSDELQQARAQHREIVASFEILDHLFEAAEGGDEDATAKWMSIARELIKEFSTFDLFYSDRREPFAGYFRALGNGNLWKESALMVLAVADNNLQDGIENPEIKQYPEPPPQDFYGVHFDKWFDVFAIYAVFLGRQGHSERCFNALDTVLQSNIFYKSKHYTHKTQACRLACGLAFDDSIQASIAIRWFMKYYPFSSDMFRLYSSLNRVCLNPNGFMRNSVLKVLVRYMKTMDFALMTEPQREKYNFQGDDNSGTAWRTKVISSDIIEHVKDHDPALFTLYGHVMMCGQSYIGALNSYFRAYAITPDDPLISLSIGVAYIQHAVNRQSENRQYQIQQGIAFMYRYRDLRTKDGKPEHQSEVDYNLGRMWHALGLLSPAADAYERCINFSKRTKEAKERAQHEKANTASQDEQGGQGLEPEILSVEDYSSEAAFALRAIYEQSGDMSAAMRITMESLVLE